MEFKIDSVRWKERFPHKGVSPVKAFEEIEKIRNEHGGTFSAEDLVQAARSKRNKLHRLFEWDDAAAAEQHRITQARTMQRSLEITYKDSKDSDVMKLIRPYEITRKQKPGSVNSPRTLYTSFEEAVKDDVTRESLLADAIRQLMALRRRFKILNELDRVFHEIDSVVETISN